MYLTLDSEKNGNSNQILIWPLSKLITLCFNLMY